MAALDNEAAQQQESDWQPAMPLAELEAVAVKMRRIAGRQIVFFNSSRGIRACDNRCPHEGYPLSEGSLSADCILTCNWHNWKFNLDNGESLFGGDRLRTYPVELRGNDIWVDLADPPYQQNYDLIVASLRDAFDDYSYDRIAREIARLVQLGADPLEVLRLAISWSWQKMEFGWTHAYAGMADWILLYQQHAGDAESQLICLSESVAHVAYDVRREKDYVYGSEASSYDEAELLAAIESEDEAGALAILRGGIRAGMRFEDFEAALSHAALAHYSDFGHSLIYLTKARMLIEALGDEVMEALLLSLLRGYIYASREDRIPEFRGYHEQLKKWGKHKHESPDAARWRQQGINKSLQLTIACSASPVEDIYRALLLANAYNFLGFDIAQQDKTRVPVSGNVGWLDFTHAITFASAVRQQCTKYPELWPQGLLQMACFSGRNAAYTSNQVDLESWRSPSPGQTLKDLIEKVLDHGQGEHIVSVHLLKTTLAVREEMALLDDGDAQLLLAGLSRFFASPIKRRQARRTAYQSLQFVSRS